MEKLELEVKEILVAMADLQCPPARDKQEEQPQVDRSGAGRRMPLSLSNRRKVPSQQHRHRGLSVVRGASHRGAPLQVVPFPTRDQFKCVKPSSTYVQLLGGFSRWKSRVESGGLKHCGCTSVVSCIHNT
ncbi:hypothetical protein M758_12G183000 [Ceratodon purpureus]|uniref:Uncharacterized protein n=1 Tax=Ceratodon purpureus TaxID=3225 RepID=A0A8T0HP05_CERPU|nr:hypothetical protein KC19_VG102000 [Ceratodon purpureus]KAG0588249.1 hypothetical protein KC19_2G228600 [Ceratodon purpureus]KAG0593242.1 hypothetical protein KC19_1G314900 [Ceratodon purpureus]KAG0599851.1 hypothetical protein M758_12G183000 [Ceratodon purpureus]